MKIISLWINRIRRAVNRFMFVRGIGKLPREYANIKSRVERMRFLVENFGLDFAEVEHEKEMNIYFALHDAFDSMGDGVGKLATATGRLKVETNRAIYSMDKFKRALHRLKVDARKRL